MLLTKECDIFFFFFQKKWSGPFLLFWVKNYYILPLDKYRHFEMNISPHRRLTAKSWKHFTEKNRTWFFHSDRSFSVLLLQDPFRKHDSFGKSLVAWRNLSPLYVKCDASFTELHISQKKRAKKKTARKGHKWNRSLLTINVGQFQFSKASGTRAVRFKLSERELISSCLSPPPVPSIACLQRKRSL